MKDLTSNLSVCFFSHSSHTFGAERSLLELITQLCRDYGVQCTVVLPGEGPLTEKLQRVGASTVDCHYSLWCAANLPTAEEINAHFNNGFEALFGKVIREVAVINPDVIVSNTMAIPWGAMSAAVLKKPHAWYIREFGDHLEFFLPFEDVLDIIKETSNLIITNSNALQELFAKTNAPRVCTVYNNIEIPTGAAILEGGQNFFTRPNATKIIITGTIHEAKGQLDAILAVKELIQRKRDVELIVMGSATAHLHELEQTIKNEGLESHVKFLAFRENPYPIVNQADIVLLCSKSEGFGRVVNEAMLLKKAVIGTNRGGTTEQIKDGYNGLLYENGDYRQLAAKIEYLIDNAQKMKEFGENGFEFVQKSFTKKGYGGKVYKLLEGLKDEINPLSSKYFDFLNAPLLALNAKSDSRQQALLLELAQKELESDRNRATAEALQEEITSIKETLGWMISTKYGRAKQQSKILSLIDSAMIVPIRSFAKKQATRHRTEDPI